MAINYKSGNTWQGRDVYRLVCLDVIFQYSGSGRMDIGVQLQFAHTRILTFFLCLDSIFLFQKQMNKVSATAQVLLRTNQMINKVGRWITTRQSRHHPTSHRLVSENDQTSETILKCDDDHSISGISWSLSLTIPVSPHNVKRTITNWNYRHPPEEDVKINVERSERS